MSRKSIAITLVILLAVAALVAGGVAMAKRPSPGGGGCPWGDIQCPDVYDPVTCDNGVTYSNSCYAFAACATGCEGGGASAVTSAGTDLIVFPVNKSVPICSERRIDYRRRVGFSEQ